LLQDPSEINGDNLNSTRREANRHFWNKKKEYLKDKEKKQQLNTQLYHSHIYNVNKWQQTWNNIEQSVEQTLKQEMEKVHLKQQQKITNMIKAQIKKVLKF
jgi:hypothetical protein